MTGDPNPAGPSGVAMIVAPNPGGPSFANPGGPSFAVPSQRVGSQRRNLRRGAPGHRAPQRRAALLALLLWQSAPPTDPPIATPEPMRYQRAIALPPGAGQACAVLDGQIFPHAAPSLKDLRVFSPQGGVSRDGPPREVPYAITLSETVAEETQPARVLNLGTSGKPRGAIVFDLEMPDRPYTDVSLDLAGRDFIATATVSGTDSLDRSQAAPTALGVFTLFDLSSQHLSRDTTLPLAESTFRYLHVKLAVTPAPGAAKAGAARFLPAMVEGAQVPPSREAQTIYTTVASASVPTTGALASPRKTRFDLPLPLRVPVERVSFDLPHSYTGNFSRDVKINASPEPSPKPASGIMAAPPIETVSGTISRVHSIEAGHRIDRRELSLAATLGSNLQTSAHVWIEVENGDDSPLPIAAVRLEMREHKLCFDAPSGTASCPTLYYGDPTLAAPVYDYDRLFVPANKPLAAQLGPELPNPGFHPPPAEVRPFTERHPEVLWIALIAVICVLGVVALRSSRNVVG